MKKIVTLLMALVLLAILVIPNPALAKAKVWSVPEDFDTIALALASPDVQNGDIIQVGPGNFAGAYVNKGVIIKGTVDTIINDGPLHGSGLVMGFRLIEGSDGAEISNLQFEVDFPVMNGAEIDDVIVEHCTMIGAVQGISNWSGCGWTISHNIITDLKTRNGGGIGILIGDWTGGIVENNIVEFNDISGTLYVGGALFENEVEHGGYAGSGIVIYADFRYPSYGYLGADEIKNNKVLHNQVSLTSNNTGLVDVVAFELTDTRDDAVLAVDTIHDNKIGFNNFSGTELQIALTPLELEEVNTISRNLGDNAGHGIHPSELFE